MTQATFLDFSFVIDFLNALAEDRDFFGCTIIHNEYENYNGTRFRAKLDGGPMILDIRVTTYPRKFSRFSVLKKPFNPEDWIYLSDLSIGEESIKLDSISASDSMEISLLILKLQPLVEARMKERLIETAVARSAETYAKLQKFIVADLDRRDPAKKEKTRHEQVCEEFGIETRDYL